MSKHLVLLFAMAGGCVTPTESPSITNTTATEATFTYAAGGDPARQVTVGISTAVPPELTLPVPETSVEWCTPASPHVPVSKSIWCQACNKGDAEDCARQWANTTAHDFCAGEISSSGGTSACAPDAYTGDICVDDTSSGITSECQVGSDTACGIWPFRHAAWKVTYNVTGNCGWSCRGN